MIRPATRDDIPAIANLIRGLADYERLTHAVSLDEVRLEGTFNARFGAAGPAAFLTEIFRVLRPGGKVVIHGLAAEQAMESPGLPGLAALVQRVPKRSLQGSSGEIRKGMQFQARTDDGMRLFTVTGVAGDMVTLDGNHPLADQTLHFDIEVVSVREATTDELEHGHVHGAGGHHH